ncbi:LysE family transporter [Cryobacterium sp. N22]|uniref:LysE family transporter n=1 Tax=Cryobacterium sp. N22 TaxID=2048290 RepID=UPI000CE3D532|nr:LysE family transporter [Cryobacterium sp. N22]
MEIELGPLLVGGLLAGWGVAVPLGAIGVLLMREALTGGFGVGAVAALAVALVDGLYCVAALAIGAAAAPVLASWGAAPAVGAGLILLLLGGLGLRRRPAAAVPRDRPRPPSPGRVFAMFAGLTAINPATLLYFGALTAALPPSLGLDRAPAVFVAGALVASLAWQLVLVTVGAFAGGRIGVRGQAVLSTCGYGLVMLLGAAAVVVALRGLVAG